MRRSIGLIVQMLVCGVLLGGCFLAGPDPVVTMSIEPSAGYSPLLVRLEAQTTSDELEPVSYEWEFGDGTSSTNGPSINHEFTGTGLIPVRLVVTDAQGR